MNNYQKEDEQLYKVVEKLMAGNMKSYEEMYNLSLKYIYKIVYDIVKDHHVTEDLVQETYITIYKKIDKLQDARKFYAWAGRIATNKTLRYIQTNKRELLTFGDDQAGDDFVFDRASMDTEEFIPESILMDKEKQRLLGEIIDGLSVEQKLCVQYFYYEDMTVAQIAKRMGCPEGTVKSRLNYARNAIKAAVVELDEKQETRLYSISAMPIFLILFRSSIESFVIPGSVATITASLGEALGLKLAGTGTATGIKAGAAKLMGTVAGKIVATVAGAGILVAGGMAIKGALTHEEYEISIVMNCDYNALDPSYLTNAIRYESIIITDDDGEVVIGETKHLEFWYDDGISSSAIPVPVDSNIHNKYKDYFDLVVSENATEWNDYLTNTNNISSDYGVVDIDIPQELKVNVRGTNITIKVDEAKLSYQYDSRYVDSSTVMGYYPPTDYAESETEPGKMVSVTADGYRVVISGRYTMDDDIKELIENARGN